MHNSAFRKQGNVFMLLPCGGHGTRERTLGGGGVVPLCDGVVDVENSHKQGASLVKSPLLTWSHRTASTQKGVSAERPSGL